MGRLFGMFKYYLCTISMRTSRPKSWALSIRDFRSSGVPQRLLGAKKFVTWYLRNMDKSFWYVNNEGLKINCPATNSSLSLSTHYKYIGHSRLPNAFIYTSKRCKNLPKARIVRMFLDSHELNSIITKLFNARKHIISELGIRVNFRLLHFKVKRHRQDYWNFKQKGNIKVIFRSCKKSRAKILYRIGLLCYVQ